MEFNDFPRELMAERPRDARRRMVAKFSLVVAGVIALGACWVIALVRLLERY